MRGWVDTGVCGHINVWVDECVGALLCGYMSVRVRACSVKVWMWVFVTCALILAGV